MRELAEVNYRETQYGLRESDGSIRRLQIGPAEAERLRASGHAIHRRDATHYWPEIGEWREATPEGIA